MLEKQPPKALVDFSDPLKYQYVTLEEHNCGYECYFSDEQGIQIESEDAAFYNDVLKSRIWYDNSAQVIKMILSSELDDNQLKAIVDALSGNQLQKIVPELKSDQLKTLAEHLTDNQLQTLVDHLTDHQLKTLAQELNETKLRIIVPILNEDQLEVLVRGLEPEQVKNILPHLKTDQLKALIKNLNDDQFAELTRDLAEHHLTVISKELGDDQLKILVNNLEGDRLKNLVNKLDHNKLEVIAQDLTDPGRVQIIIKSLTDSPEKLQVFARNVSNEQFKELLDNLDAKELKDIIHKLPYEKVTAVIGRLSNKDQYDSIIEMLKEKFAEQNAKQEKMMEILDKIKTTDEVTWDSSPYLQAELIAMEEYTQPGIRDLDLFS